MEQQKVSQDAQNQPQEVQGAYDLPQQILQLVLDKISWQDLTKQQEKKYDTFYEIVIPKQYKKHYTNLHFLLQKQQLSLRSGLLSLYLLCIRTSNYYALMLRKDCYEFFQNPKNRQKMLDLTDSQANDFLKFDLKSQLHFMNCLLNTNPKEYHIWNYKKQLILKQVSSQKGCNQQEIYILQNKFLETMFQLDSKNYHAWDYKFWLTVNLCSSLKKINQELDKTFIQIFRKDMNKQAALKYVDKDCYSLWSYRFNLLKIKSLLQQNANWQQIRHGALKGINNEILCKQATIVLQFLMVNAYNECGWNYINGIFYCFDDLKSLETIKILKHDIIKLQTQLTFKIGQIQNQSQRKSQQINLRFLLTCLLTIKQIEIRNQGMQQPKNELKKQRKQIIIELKRIDFVRQLYYDFLLDNQSD